MSQVVPTILPTALEALDHARDGEAFDVASQDMCAPVLDGMNLALEIGRRRGPTGLRIVMLTSSGRRHAVKAGHAVELAACLPA